MNEKVYDDILASLDRAIAVMDQQPERFGVEREAYERLVEIRARVAAEKAKNSKAD